jgi:hypothetical protein
MNSSPLTLGILLFTVAHIIVFFQLNGQFLWKWFRDNELIMGLIGVPVALLMLWGTKYTVEGFDGLLWPTRFVGFGLGMVIYAIGVSYYFNEGFSSKTLISLVLSVVLIFIQVLWKD